MARPTLHPDLKRRTIGVRLNTSEIAALDDLAQRWNVSRNDAIVRAVGALLEQIDSTDSETAIP